LKNAVLSEDQATFHICKHQKHAYFEMAPYFKCKSELYNFKHFFHSFHLLNWAQVCWP